jgi:outer membrane protein
MKRIFILLGFVGLTNIYAQKGRVGVNTDTPKATLDIKGMPGSDPNNDKMIGILIPRVTAAEMKTMSMDADFGEDQHTILVYLTGTMPTIDQADKHEYVTDEGFYYWNNTALKWIPLNDLRYVGRGNHITMDAGKNGTSLPAGSNNIGIGKGSLNANTGSNNIAVGTSALLKNTLGSGAVAIGTNALIRNTKGKNNIAIGTNTLTQNTEADNNIAIGITALNLNTEGTNNVAIGGEALTNNKKGKNNIALGPNTLRQNIDADNNFAIGLNALEANTIGQANMAVGNGALSRNTNGGYNMAFGYNTMPLNLTGSYNIALGYNSANQIVNGNYNTVIGTGGSYINNGNGNISIGNSEAGTDTASLDNIIAIGHGITPTTDNTIVLGNSTATGPKVGVGTYTPQAKLDVNGDIRVGGTTTPCSVANEGAIRYESSLKKFQGCDGSSWVSLH